MLLKKIVLISTIMTSSLALAYDPTTPSYYLTKNCVQNIMQTVLMSMGLLVAVECQSVETL
ncbi:hypothetical protein SAMN05216500_103125 [Acinetobacter sp. DSM 11652]|nr:hypothetical protein SAMN05216500_103125 [Acinetobacter sp. DSM 11652]